MSESTGQIEELPIEPSLRLIRDGMLFSKVAAVSLVVTSVIDAAKIAVFALRLGRVAGMLNGGFAFTISLPWLSDDAAINSQIVPISSFSLGQSVLATMLLSLRLAPGMHILWCLFRLFRMYGQGQVFTELNERYVRRIAWSLLAYAVVPLITHAALFLAHMSTIPIKLEVRQFDAAVCGLILLALAHIVSFGCAIERDREGFV